MKTIDAKLERLATLSPAELRLEWQASYSQEAPTLSPALLRMGLAYRWQEKNIKGGIAKTTRALRSLATGKKGPPSFKVGTKLVRSWNGRTIAVMVEEQGFLFEDRKYRSLSAIAKEVTGAHWSGPRFFGLNELAQNG